VKIWEKGMNRMTCFFLAGSCRSRSVALEAEPDVMGVKE